MRYINKKPILVLSKKDIFFLNYPLSYKFGTTFLIWPVIAIHSCSLFDFIEKIENPFFFEKLKENKDQEHIFFQTLFADFYLIENSDNLHNSLGYISKNSIFNLTGIGFKYLVIHSILFVLNSDLSGEWKSTIYWKDLTLFLLDPFYSDEFLYYLQKYQFFDREKNKSSIISNILEVLEKKNSSSVQTYDSQCLSNILNFLKIEPLNTEKLLLDQSSILNNSTQFIKFLKNIRAKF